MNNKIIIPPDKVERLDFYGIIARIKDLKQSGVKSIEHNSAKGVTIFIKSKEIKGKKSGFDEYFFIFGGCNVYWLCEVLENKIKHNFPVLPNTLGFYFDVENKNIIWKR